MKGIVEENFKILQQKWLASLDMFLELNKAGFSLPKASEHLRHVKSMISEAMLNRSADYEFFAQADSLMDEAQREIFMAGEPLGQDFIERWDKVFKGIMSGEKYGEFRLSSSKFYPHLPRGEYWVRIKQPEEASQRKLREISTRNGVDIKEHMEEHILIAGEKEDVKRALQEISGYM